MDDQKNQILIAVAVFSVIVMLYQFILNSGDDFSYLGVVIAMTIGAVGGGIAFVVAGMMKK
jgi:hypothetical protein